MVNQMTDGESGHDFSQLPLLQGRELKFARFFNFSILASMIFPFLISISFSDLKSLRVRISDSVAVPTYCAISSREISMGMFCSLSLNFAVISTRAVATRFLREL